MKLFAKLNFCLNLSLFLLLLIHNPTFAQLPGLISRQATSTAGRLVLDPNNDGYTSATTSGFTNDDDASSELLYYAIKAYPAEPFGDLRRGPDHRFSDFVSDSAGNGVYFRFSPAQQMMFRMRLGSVMPGSKGYSILMDTDGKFGATGPDADPNYLPKTNGVNGNPGFEIEIVLETNFRIAVYTVDGTSTPVLVKQYTNWQDMSQVSIALTNDNGDPDFFIDFYIPFSDLQAAPFNLTTASTIRMTATTVMAPKASIGGPLSDVYGGPGHNYEDFILAQPSCTIFTNPVTCPTNMCTNAPSVNSPLSVGTVNISGTWTKSILTGAAGTATITVYKNGISIGTIANVSSGSGWTVNGIHLLNGDAITAKAQAPAESMCLTSNKVIASSCTLANIPATPTLSCTSGSKGLGGTNLSSGWTVHVDNITRNVLDNNVSNSTGLFGAQTGSSPAITWIFSGGCNTGAPLTSGSYKIYYTNNTTGCTSLPAYFCAVGNGNSALAGTLAVPIITTPASAIFTTATTTISGTTAANATVYLFINGKNLQSVVATTGVFTFSGLTLLGGQQLYISTELNTGTVGTSKCENQTIMYTVSCYTSVPLITADNNNQLSAGAFITGTSAEPAGTTIKVFTSIGTLVATTAVQANGTWSTGNAGTTPALYNAVAAIAYYANAQNGGCGVSSNSAIYAAATLTSSARCGTITGPVNAGATSISGTLTGSFSTTTVNLYLDGQLIGSYATNNAAWGPITVNTTPSNTLYSNGVLGIGIQENGKQETACPSSLLEIICTPIPTAPDYSISSRNVNQYQSVNVTITNAVTGTFYALSDSATGQSYGKGKWATSNGNLVLTTGAFNNSGTYKIKVNATSLSGVTLCSAVSATLSVMVNAVVLPLYLTQFTGRKESAKVYLEWLTENELGVNRFEIEHCNNGISFNKIGIVIATGFTSLKSYYNFLHVKPVTGANYYRLKMVDNNGKFTYSNVVVLKGYQDADIIVNNVSPNPFTEKINFIATLNKALLINLQVFDFSGRVYTTKIFEGKKGNNNIELNGLGKLAQGSYYIKVVTPYNAVVQKIVKFKK